jgi:polyhydroxyalkanoate synthesis repressor PhaR
MLRRTKTAVMLVKKYSNRRLYDTESSRYITLEELAARIRDGADVRIVDAKTGADLTQATLVQLILEGPSARGLPTPLLVQLVRMGDDAAGEFFGKYLSMAMEWYLAARFGIQQAAPMLPFGNLPMQATNALFRMLGGGGFSAPPPAPPPPPRAAAPRDEPDDRDDVAALRRELEELKRQVDGQSTRPTRRR